MTAVTELNNLCLRANPTGRLFSAASTWPPCSAAQNALQCLFGTVRLSDQQHLHKGLLSACKPHVRQDCQSAGSLAVCWLEHSLAVFWYTQDTRNALSCREWLPYRMLQRSMQQHKRSCVHCLHYSAVAQRLHCIRLMLALTLNIACQCG
jgi:hypothetical protein